MNLGYSAAVTAVVVVLAGCSTVAGPAATPAPTPTPTEARTPAVSATATSTPTPTATPVPDRDADGLNATREQELGTSDFYADSDTDGLNDTLELELGLNPAVEDTDGDRLPDGWELDTEATDPRHLDLVVTVVYERGSVPLTPDQRSNLTTVWAQMPVENPDGSTGIVLHLRLQPVGELRTFTGANERTILDAHERPERGVMLIFTDFGPGLDYVGTTWGPTVAFIDAGWGGTRHGYDNEVLTTTHELLHLVVGDLTADGSEHVDAGWLGTHGNARPFMADETQAYIEENGFEEE